MATDATSPIEQQGSSPDWNKVAGQVQCPLCAYDLRGLVEPRCPECGYRFAWDEVLDPDRQPHPYLFEHHPEKNVRSFCRTLLGGLRPRRFWRTLRPSQPSCLHRLLIYGVLTALLCLVLTDYNIGQVAGSLRWKIVINRRQQGGLLVRPLSDPALQQIIKQYGSYQDYAESIYPTHINLAMLVQVWDQHPLYWQTWVWLPGWLLTGLASLLIFRISMRRARVRMVHVLRCLLYSFDALLWAGPIVCVASLTTTLLQMPSALREILYGIEQWTLPAMMLVVVYRLIIAYKLYLRFDHPAATILASQLICLLAATTAMQYRLFYWESGHRIFQWILMWPIWAGL